MTEKRRACPDCGETDPAKFYRNGHKKCKECTAVKNKIYYQSIKAQCKKLKQKRIVKNRTTCMETPGMSVDKKATFFVFCQKRREIKQGRGNNIPNCLECGLGKKVDAGFLPVNISILAWE